MPPPPGGTTGPLRGGRCAERRFSSPVMAYSPIEQGRLLRNAKLVDFSRKHGMTPAQAALAWFFASDDIIVIPKPGMFYDPGLTESPVNPTNKIAEHGGFSDDDVHVPLVVYNPGLSPQSIKTQVETAQIAPTAMQILGLSPFSLQAVVRERTQLLPGFEADGV